MFSNFFIVFRYFEKSFNEIVFSLHPFFSCSKSFESQLFSPKEIRDVNKKKSEKYFHFNIYRYLINKKAIINLSQNKFSILNFPFSIKNHFLFITLITAAIISGVSRWYFFINSSGVPLSPKESFTATISTGVGK